MSKTHYDSFTDDELALLAATDKQAFNALICRYLDSVKYDAGSFAVGRNGYIDADDYRSEGVLGLISAVKHYDPQKDAGFATFAKICSSNRMKNAYNKSKRVFNHETNIDDSQADTVADFDEDISLHELNAAVSDAIKNNLSNLEAKVLLGYLGGLSYKEIALRLDISEKSVDNALTRIRRKLRDKI